MKKQLVMGTIVLIVVVVVAGMGIVRSRRAGNDATESPVLSLAPMSDTTMSENTSVGNVSDMAPADGELSILSGNYTYTLTTEDGIRSYLVHIPEGYDPGKLYPVLFGFHGGFGTAEQFERSSHFSTLADERGFIVVYGQGTAWGLVKAPVWNAGDCCGQAVESDRDIDDVGYVRSVIADIQNRYSVDTSRIYMAGMSNGGMMVNRLACEASDLFSGGAAVSGTIVFSPCNPDKSIPMLLMHGTADENVPYDGGVGKVAFNKTDHISVEQAFADWGKRNACVGMPVTTPVPPLASDGKTVDKLEYRQCGEPVVLYRVNGGIHEWPGGGANSNALEQTLPTKVIDASQTIADFFNL